MTLLERLQSHKGGLIRLKTALYWYDGLGWDGSPGRVCLILDAAYASCAAAITASARAADLPLAAVLLLIDGCPHWVWVSQEDVELL